MERVFSQCVFPKLYFVVARHIFLLLVKNISLLNDSFFNEFVISLPSSSKDFVEHACRKGIMAGLPVERLFFSLPNSKNMLLIAATELNTDNDIKKLVKLFKDYF